MTPDPSEGPAMLTDPRTGAAPDPTLLAMAQAMAIEGEENGCFERVAEWEAITDPDERADYAACEGVPFDDYEDCARWLRKAHAALTVDPLRVPPADAQPWMGLAVDAAHKANCRVPDCRATSEAENAVRAAYPFIAAAATALAAQAPLPELSPTSVARLLDTDVDGETVREEFTPQRFDDLEVGHVERLVNHAVDAGLLPPGTLVWATADGDSGGVDGALVTWTSADNRRYASHHQDFHDLTTDRDAVGDALAYAVLDAVRLIVKHECMPGPDSQAAGAGAAYWPPVVSSPAGVAVEVPEGAVAAARRALELHCSAVPDEMAADAVAAAYPLIAARVRAEDGGAESKAWHKRRLIEFAQAVDSRVGSVHIAGTFNESERVWLARAAVGLAREVLDGDCAAPNEWVEVVRAEERQRIAADLIARAEQHEALPIPAGRPANSWTVGKIDAYREVAATLAAGSAVPVATPGPTVDGVRTAALALLRWRDDPTAERAVLGSILARLHLPVATPPEREMVQLVEARLQRWANEVRRKRHRPPVSVATPQPAADAETLRDLAPADSIMGDTMCEIADRLDASVATPSEPGPAEPPKDLLAALQASVDRARGVAPAEQDGQR